MKKYEAEPMVESAKATLTKMFPQYAELIADTQVYLLTSTNKVEKRNRIAEELAAPKINNLEDTAGQTIVGAERYAIIMFYPSIHAEEFTHYLYHEFGHVISNRACRALFDKAQEYLDLNRDTPLRSGMAVWSELVAEVIAYRAENAPPSPIAWYAAKRMEVLMDAAVNSGFFSPYDFAFYCAMFFADPTIVAYMEAHPHAAVGANHCDDEIMPRIEAALIVIDEQLSKEEYWVIAQEQLVELGKCVNNLWDYCSEMNQDYILAAFAEHLRESMADDIGFEGGHSNG